MERTGGLLEGKQGKAKLAPVLEEVSSASILSAPKSKKTWPPDKNSSTIFGRGYGRPVEDASESASSSSSATEEANTEAEAHNDDVPLSSSSSSATAEANTHNAASSSSSTDARANTDAMDAAREPVAHFWDHDFPDLRAAALPGESQRDTFRRLLESEPVWNGRYED